MDDPKLAGRELQEWISKIESYIMTKVTFSQPNNKWKIIYLVKKTQNYQLGYLSRNNSLGRGIAKKDLAYNESQTEYFSNVRYVAKWE